MISKNFSTFMRPSVHTLTIHNETPKASLRIAEYHLFVSISETLDRTENSMQFCLFGSQIPKVSMHSESHATSLQ